MTRFAHGLFLVLPAWQRLRDLGLPLWARDRCRNRIVRRLPSPVAGCPNTMLLAMH